MRSMAVTTVREAIAEALRAEGVQVLFALMGDGNLEVYRMYAEAAQNDPDMPRKVVVFVGELNKYAPARARGVRSIPRWDAG